MHNIITLLTIKELKKPYFQIDANCFAAGILNLITRSAVSRTGTETF